MNKKGFSTDSFKNKNAQVTIFIIIAIIIVGLAVLLYFLIPKAGVKVVFDEKNPQGFIQSCMEDKLEETIEKVSLQGGSVNPEFYFTYNNIPIDYLCYTNQNNSLCVIQQPILKQHIENEIKDEIEADVTGCFNSLKESYERRNYNVQMEPGASVVELLPNRVVANFNYVLSVSKSGQTSRHDSFRLVLNNNIYELTGIAMSIINWEASYGDADPRIYMALYSDIEVGKNIMGDNTKIYIITDRNSGDKFQFASKSLSSEEWY